MLVKRPPTTSNVLAIRTFDRQLQDLYARRSRIESLVQALEEYQRVRSTRFDLQNSKTA